MATRSQVADGEFLRAHNVGLVVSSASTHDDMRRVLAEVFASWARLTLVL